MVSVVQESAVQESTSDNTRTSSLSNNSIHNIESTLRISSNSSSIRKQPLCKYAASKQVCPFGTKCRFRHPVVQHHQSIKPVCRHFLQGQCRYGNRCKFRHPKDESENSGLLFDEKVSPESTAVLNVRDFPSISLSKKPQSSNHGNKSQPPPLQQQPAVEPLDRGRRVIHHDGSHTAPVELQLAAFFKRATTITTKPAVPRPGGKKQQKKTGVENKLDLVLKTEMRLLQEENMEEIEPRDEEVHILKFQPSSPEWVSTVYNIFCNTYVTY